MGAYEKGGLAIVIGPPDTSHISDVPHGETFFYTEKKNSIAVKKPMVYKIEDGDVFVGWF